MKMDNQQQQLLFKMREAAARGLSKLPAQKKPGMDEVTFDLSELISGGISLGDYVGVLGYLNLDTFTIKKDAGLHTLIVTGYDSLNMLADIGVNFPGSSSYRSNGAER